MALTVKPENTHAPPSGVAPDRSGVSMAGLAAGISGSLIWGSAFAVPVLLGGWNPVIVTLGRYLVYGPLSAILFAIGCGGPRRAPREYRRTTLVFALAGRAGCYLSPGIAIKAACAPLTEMGSSAF